jgi:hypothetical protein
MPSMLTHGFQLNYDIFCSLANNILLDHGAPYVSINWPANFVKHIDVLKIQKYNY